MKDLHLHLLNKNGYEVLDEEAVFILKMKLIQNKNKAYVFFPLAILFLLLWVISTDSMDLMNLLIFFSTSIILFSIPFWELIIAPYYSFCIDKKAKKIIFKGRGSRTYMFSEVTKFSVSLATRYADTSPFSNSNKEFDYRLHFSFGKKKEEIFKILEENGKSEYIIVEMKEYFEEMLE